MAPLLPVIGSAHSKDEYANIVATYGYLQTKQFGNHFNQSLTASTSDALWACQRSGQSKFGNSLLGYWTSQGLTPPPPPPSSKGPCSIAVDQLNEVLVYDLNQSLLKQLYARKAHKATKQQCQESYMIIWIDQTRGYKSYFQNVLHIHQIISRGFNVTFSYGKMFLLQQRTLRGFSARNAKNMR